MLEKLETPAPLSFFKKDSIDPDNQKLRLTDERRYRLLSWSERLRLEWYVWGLGRRLRRGGWNQLVSHFDMLRTEYETAAATYKRSRFLNDTDRTAAQQRIKAIADEARRALAGLTPMRETYANFQHYSRWLHYERRHRADLRREASAEKRIRREMRLEAKWLEQIILDVFRKTAGCHHIYKARDGEKEITKTPKFERSIIMPDAHYFYLAATKRVLFGWKWLLPHGVNISRLTDEEVMTNLRAATKRQVDPIWSEQGQLMYRVSRLDSPDALPKLVRWNAAMKVFPAWGKDKFAYTIGAGENRRLKWFNLVDSPHILVAGKSQSGKSNLVNGIIATLVSTHSPAELRAVFIDQKGGIEFTHWVGLPHMLGNMIKTVDGVKPALQNIVNIMRQRMGTLERSKAKDIAAYNRRVDENDQMERILVIIDEMNTFVGLGKQTEDIHNLIMLLVSQGRAVGVHVITATQHPEVKVIPGRIKTNIAMRISGAMPSFTASQIVLDSPIAANLPNLSGRMAAVEGMSELIVQAPLIEDDEIAGVISAAQREFIDIKETLSDAPEILPVWDENRVLESCLEFLEGQLSGEKLHHLLDSESPGEHHLRKMVKRIRENAEAGGGILTSPDGQKWTIKRVRRAYYLSELSEQPEQSNAPIVGESSAD